MRFEKTQVERKITQKYFLWQKNAVGGRCFPSAATFDSSGRCVTCCAWGGGDYPSKIVGNHRKCPAGAAPSKRYLFWRFLHAPLGKKDYSELWFDILSEIGNLYRWRGLKQLVAPKAKTISSCLWEGESRWRKNRWEMRSAFCFHADLLQRYAAAYVPNARDGYC